MRRVIIESAFRSSTPEGLARNITYARACVRDCLARNEAPLASHLLYTQPEILDDNIPAEREQGINAGLAWQTAADAVAVYTDLGTTNGMELAIDRARYYNIPVKYRSLPGWAKRPPRLVEVCPAYATALAQFTAAAESGDLESADYHWNAACEAATAYRARVRETEGAG